MNEDTTRNEAATGSHVTVRACEPEDMAAVAAIFSQPGVRHGTLSLGYRSAEAMTVLLGRFSSGSTSICAELDGRVVGHGGLRAYRPTCAHGADLSIAVDDAYCRRGVGSALMRALIDCADHSLGLRRLELMVFADNAAAIALYRKFDFIEEGRSRGYAMQDGVLVDALHMARLVDAPPLATVV
ncbi:MULTISPECIES: GNAT family N-acetyltransferase [Paraburkholderia]|uniref:GNAT family N-acetyltransferase n=1 Tax=Paraburkholderia TaxID=1822464 RepID=UPI0022555709|nr:MULTISPECIES: GNAT family N-acetyltransferase [Paraburkholderia]MCX4165977.1 GNAT family N-acetyltransferase [Paraburkholderia megapolitana]MDN7161468.1 GNAT family N-acetyltransferase [Paraburkholderia sp. CHISQ3]MDQ6498515.1 GNAT family N-acetyltransferase [Paraburkholderia megapolitana]